MRYFRGWIQEKNESWDCGHGLPGIENKHPEKDSSVFAEKIRQCAPSLSVWVHYHQRVMMQAWDRATY